MRKSRIKCLADTIFWYALYSLPLITYLIFILSEPGNGNTTPISMVQFWNQISLGLASNNIITNAIESIIGNTGIIPLFSGKTPIILATWFINTYILHLIVDTLLFIPRFAHKLLEKTTEEK